MICTPNVPPAVRNWAVCERRIAWMSSKLHSLERGEPQGFVEALRLRAAGRPGYSPEETEEKRRRLTCRIRHYSALRSRIENTLPRKPASYLFREEQLPELVGSTLKWRKHKFRGNAIFETITHVAPDGKGICSVLTEGSHPLTPLDLLCRGFGVTA